MGNVEKDIRQVNLRYGREFEGEKITLSINYARDLISPFRIHIAKHLFNLE